MIDSSTTASTRAGLDAALLSIENPDRRRKLIDTVLAAIDDVNAGRADRILVAARRMTCLYALMLRNGLANPANGRVSSDRFIELLPDGAWIGERIILLDDTSFTGETVTSRKAAAERVVGESGQVEDRIALPLGDTGDDVALRLHNQFALAFGRSLLPFFTDFAISTEMPASALTLAKILADTEWNTVDVTNSVLAGTGARAFSLFLQGDLAAKFRESLGHAADLVEIAKIRLFVDENFGQLRIRVVPIVLLRSVTVDSLAAWLGQLGTDRVPVEFSAQLTSHAAGLATFMLSRALLHAFSAYARDSLHLDVVEDVELTELVLGQAVAGLAAATPAETLAVLRPTHEDESDTFLAPVFEWPGRKASTSAHYTVAGDDAARAGFRVVRSRRGKPHPYTTLSEMARNAKSNVAASSVAVDILNDLGYSVPTFVSREGSVVRSYRPGEADVRFEDLEVGRLGGRLASVPKTEAIPDEEYLQTVALIERTDAD